MVKSAAKKVMFVGRATVFMVGFAVILALTVGVASAAFGANGGNFILGQTNAASAITKLAGAAGVAGPSLQIDNNSTNAAATALDLQVEPGKAPMKVNSDTQVANLNADKLDGKNSSDFVPTELYVESDTFTVSSGSSGVFSAFCDPGDVAVSGGYAGGLGGLLRSSSAVLQNRPDALEERWMVGLSTGTVGDTLVVFVRCADFPPLRP